MCDFKSGIIFKNKIVLCPEGNESHSDLLKSLNIEDNYINASKVFVRAELTPPNYNKAIPIEEWGYRVDQDVVPDWYEKDPKRYEEEFRNKVKDEVISKLNIICGYSWTEVKDKDSNLTYYFMDGFFDNTDFGINNNYANSKIRKDLNNSNLVKELKEKFGDKIFPISTVLLSLDGLDDYGVVEGDILAIPTLDLYRKFRKDIPKLNSSWWLATPYSTLLNCNAIGAMYVYSDAFVGYNWHGNIGNVRPFFILQS